jgi:hypothetical protein
MSNVIDLPRRDMEPPEPPNHSWCDQCSSEVAEETWALGAQVLCRPHALLVVAEATLDPGFSKLDLATAIAHRDILNASLEACEARLRKLSGGNWSGSQP